MRRPCSTLWVVTMALPPDSRWRWREAVEGSHRRLVQAGLGLVEEQQRRAVQDRAGEGGAPLHAVGEGTNSGGHDRADAEGVGGLRCAVGGRCAEAVQAGP